VRTSLRLLCLGALLLAWTQAYAGQLISEFFQFEGEGGTTEVELVLALNLELESAFENIGGNVYRARIAQDSEDARLDWQMAELMLDEPGFVIESIAVEGSTAKGFTVQVAFSEPVTVATIPQYASNRIALKYISGRDFQKASSRAKALPADGTPWAVDLGVSEPLLDLKSTPRALLLNRALYFAPLPEEPQSRVRLGFLTKGSARSLLRQIQGQFPAATLVNVTDAEVAYGNAMRLNTERINSLYSGTSNEKTHQAAPQITVTAATAGVLEEAPEPTATELKDWQAQPDDSVLVEAKDAYIAGDYSRSVALYTKASGVPAFRLEALEMLGVTREQTGQLAHAKRAYETVLAEYPGTEAAARVTARLQSLVSIDKDPKTLRKPSRQNAPAWNVLANVSQFYRRTSIDIERRGTIVPVDGIFTDAALSVRRQSRHSSHEGRLSLGHIQDFSDQSNIKAFRVQEAFWESISESLKSGVRVGRQRQRTSGVLGRFDGITASYFATETMDLNVVAGYLVDSSYDSVSTDRSFWGVNTEYRLLDSALTLTPFFVQQQYEGITDRQAAGLQVEYYADRFNSFGMVDYDLHHEALNLAYVTGNYQLSQRTRLYGAVDHRRNPYLTTRNALIGQPLEDLTELELQLIEETLEDVAKDRTAMSTMVRLGVDGALAEGWAYSMDASFTDFQGTDASLNVAALDSHQDFFYSAQIRADNAFGQGNYGAIQMRYFSADTAEAVGLYFNNRFTIADSWWLYPRLLLDQRKSTDTDLKQVRIKPSLRLDYRYNRRFRMEVEAGYEWTSREMAAGDLDMQGLFLRAGYRALF
jgi:hypothetical protein